ncbi:MAG: tetratricopeptide repeat protein [Planctomycetota bacterium]
MLRPALLSALALVACSSPPADVPGDGDPLPAIPAKVRGMDRAVLSLVFELEGEPRTLDALRCWFQEAMRLSPWLDVDDELGEEAEHRLLLRGRLERSGTATAVLTTSYLHADEAPVPLASVLLEPGLRLARAVDGLARGTRLGLGEPEASVLATSPSVEACVSADEVVAAACTRARRSVARKDPVRAVGELQQALRRDPASAYARTMLSSLYLDLGKVDEALAMADHVGTTPLRSTPRIIHDAKRDQLLANGRYQDAIRLAELTLGERPRDPHVAFTKDLALCMLQRYDEALPELERLALRLPRHRGVLFCLAYARLGTGDPEGCLALLPRLEDLLDLRLTTRLRCLALYGMGRLDELRGILDALADEPRFRGQPGQVEQVGIRACFALLEHRDDEARRLLLDQLDLLRSMPEVLEASPSIAVDAVWTLCRLGAAKEARQHVEALAATRPRERHGDRTLLLCIELCRVELVDDLPQAPFQHLGALGLREQQLRLEARALQRQGHPDRALDLQRQIARTSRDPGLVAETADSLRALGQLDEAHRVLVEVARYLAKPRMDQPSQHPLLRSKYALVTALASRR